MTALRFLLGCLLANTAIAGFLSGIGYGGTFAENWIFSQCIGLSIMGSVKLVLHFVPRSPALWPGIIGAILLGTFVGQFLGQLFTGHTHATLGPIALQSLLIGLLFGGIASVFFYLRERTQLLSTELQARELQRIEAERRSIEAQLKMLQAQIEPHFLFNTLANLAGLIEADPKLASRLLEALNHYLRASLIRTRADGGTLGDEMDLLTAYLEVLKIRLGPRLEYSIDVPDPLRALPFPPMLLQPLVENAVQHGIEPQVAGGRIDIVASCSEKGLQLSVRDTGAGFSDAPGNGIGLANIRARLAALFGAAATLEIAEHAEGGVLASLQVPQ